MESIYKVLQKKFERRSGEKFRALSKIATFNNNGVKVEEWRAVVDEGEKEPRLTKLQGFEIVVRELIPAKTFYSFMIKDDSIIEFTKHTVKIEKKEKYKKFGNN